MSIAARSVRAADGKPPGAERGAASGRAGYFFSTFQRKVTGELMTPERVVR